MEAQQPQPYVHLPQHQMDQYSVSVEPSPTPPSSFSTVSPIGPADASMMAAQQNIGVPLSRESQFFGAGQQLLPFTYAKVTQQVAHPQMLVMPQPFAVPMVPPPMHNYAIAAPPGQQVSCFIEVLFLLDRG